LKNVQIQLFCTNLYPKAKQVQGANVSILTALKITKPGANHFLTLAFAASHTLTLHIT